MITQIVAIHDRALDAYMQPFHVNALGQAIRAFGDEIQRKDSEPGKHPEDYDLYHLGTFDNETGNFTNLSGGPKQIAIGKNYAPAELLKRE